MAVSVKISQLLPGGSIQSQDELPISRAGLETFKLAASQIVTTASNVGVGTGQMFLNKLTTGSGNLQFRSLSGADGLAVANSGNTLVISASGQNPVKTSITGNGTTTTFAVNEANSINANNYRVDIDGVLQEPLTDYTISGSNIVFSTPPPLGGKVTIVSNNLVRAYDIVPSDGSVTANKIALSAVTTDKILNNAVTPAKLSIGGPNWNSSGSTTITTLSVLQYFHYPPDFDSGWSNMSAQQGVNSYRQYDHNLGQYPAHVKVLTRAVDGNNNGFIFEATGGNGGDDEQNEYGGCIFAYDQNRIRIWLPSRYNGTASGYAIMVSDGWGGDVNFQASFNAQVRVLAWRGFYNLT
jgi:hypothetical protein